MTVKSSYRLILLFYSHHHHCHRLLTSICQSADKKNTVIIPYHTLRLFCFFVKSFLFVCAHVCALIKSNFHYHSSLPSFHLFMTFFLSIFILLVFLSFLSFFSFLFFLFSSFILCLSLSPLPFYNIFTLLFILLLLNLVFDNHHLRI